MCRLVVLACALCGLGWLCAQESVPETDAPQLWQWAGEEVDAANQYAKAGKASQAMIRYRSAIAGLEGLLKRFPQWRMDVVRLRLAYCRGQLAACQVRKLPANYARELQEQVIALAGELEELSGASGTGGAVWRALQQRQRLENALGAQQLELHRKQQEIKRLKQELQASNERLRLLEKARNALGTVLEERDRLADQLAVTQKNTATAGLHDARQGDSGQSSQIKDSERERQRQQSLERYRLRARQCEGHGDGASAARYWHLCTRYGGDPLECWSRAAYWYWRSGEQAKFEACREKFVAVFAPHARYFGMLARILLSQKQREMALALASLSVCSAPLDASCQVSLGVALMEAGALERAEKQFRQVIEHAPQHGEALMSLASLLASQGEAHKPEARKFYERALAAGQTRVVELEAYFGQPAASKE